MPIALPPIPTHPTALGISPGPRRTPLSPQPLATDVKPFSAAANAYTAPRSSSAHHGAPPLGPLLLRLTSLREISEEGWKQPKASAEYISEFRDGSFLEPRSSNTVGYGTFSPTSYKLQSSSRTQ